MGAHLVWHPIEVEMGIPVPKFQSAKFEEYVYAYIYDIYV